MTLSERVLNAHDIAMRSNDKTTAIVWMYLADIYWKNLIKKGKRK